MPELISSTLVSGRGSTGDNINRDVEQVISNIDRQDTPFISMAGDKKVKHTTHEWLTDDYENASFQAYKENYQYSASDVTQEVRTVLNNNTQIFLEPYGVSDTTIAVDTIGVANEFNYQGIKKGVKMKRNIERQALSQPASGDVQGAVKSGAEAGSGDLDGATDGGRRFGSVFSYASIHSTPTATATGTNSTTLTEVADDNNDGTNNSVQTINTAGGSLAAVRANGTSVVRVDFAGTNTDRNLTRALINEHMAEMYSVGSRPNVAMMSPTMKVNFSRALYADGTSNGIVQRLNASESKINMAIDMVSTDFGFNLKLVPNWLYNNATGTGNTDPNNILFYDQSMVKTGTLRPMSTKRDLGQSGDGMRGIIRCEKTLVVQNPASVGVLHAVSETT